MKDICWLDIILLLPLLYGLIRGLIRGMFDEINALVAIVAAIVLARIWGPDLARWIQKVDDWSMQICTILSYVVLFLGCSIVLKLIGDMLQKLMKKIQLNWINRILGGICGCIKWAAVMLVVVFVVDQVDQQFKVMPTTLTQQSIVYKPAVEAANTIWSIHQKRH